MEGTMKNLKQLMVFVLVLIMSGSVLAGCNLTGTPSAGFIYDKYLQIVENYTTRQAPQVEGELGLIIPEESLFNANANFAITYAESNLQYEIVQRIDAVTNPETAIFSVFNRAYPTTLYTSLLFFNYYRHNLLDDTNNWNSDHLKQIYDNLLAFEDAIKEFHNTKITLENISIAYNEQNLTSPYSYSIMLEYEDFKQTYENLIEKAIALSKSFEQAFFETVSQSNQFLQSVEVPYFEARRSIYSASIYLAEATYHYYINHNNGFSDENAEDGLYNDILQLRNTIQNAQIPDANVTQGADTQYYRTLRAHERQIASQSTFYVDAILLEKQLRNSTKPEDVSLYEDYITIVNEATQNYRNYASYALEMLTRIAVIH
jgi:hypothetical protein